MACPTRQAPWPQCWSTTLRERCHRARLADATLAASCGDPAIKPPFNLASRSNSPIALRHRRPWLSNAWGTSLHPKVLSLPHSRSFRRSSLATAAPSLAICHSFAWLCAELVTTTSRCTRKSHSRRRRSANTLQVGTQLLFV